MLSPQDDNIGHQLPTTFNHVVSSDDRWTERYWYSGAPIDTGDVLLDLGLGWYPNKNIMDMFAGITVDNVQHSYRVSRQLGSAPLETAAGALRFEIVEGLKHHRLTLAENDLGLSFEIDWRASFKGLEEHQSFRRKRNRVEEDLIRMTQFGRMEGWIELNGRRIEVSPDTWYAQRDHSWGIRSVMQTDMITNGTLPTYKDFFWFWLTYQFEDFAISLFLKERKPGKPFFLSGLEIGSDGEEREIIAVDHEIEWADDPLGQTWSGGTLVLHYEDGGTRELTLVPQRGRFFLKGGGYGGHQGWDHGDNRGKLHSDHYVWDLSDPETRRQARQLGDHFTRVECGGQTGYGMSEYGVAKGYPKYQIAQRHEPL
ncbi:hypothetical protein ACFO5X_19815 [Seohaeicola nanhaiensis]|uniref:AttH domain-containing protein n=1 Tax=Seohaeicola nanhaiensis TaxID=1387282 RepID=A0ABV9KL38_9RHOB